MTERQIYLLFGAFIFLLCVISMAAGFLFWPFFTDPRYNFIALLRAPNFQEHKWTMMKVEYCTLPEANYMMLKSGTKADGSEALKLREIKYFTIDNPEIVRNAMKLIRPKSKWLMGVGVVRGTEIRDESGNIWDMAIREERIYVAIRPSPTSFTTASFGFETNNDFAHYLRNIAFEIEKKTNPNIKLERVGLPYFQFGVSPSKRAVCPQKKGTNHLV